MNTSIFGLLWFALVGGLGLGYTPVSDSPEMVRAQYEQAAAHLDAGGDFYAVNSVKGQALHSLEKIGPMLLSIQHTQQGNEKPALLEQIKQFMTDHGALSTHTLAASTVPRKDGLRDIKFFVGRDSTARSSHFWRGLAGREPRPARHLPGLSKHTVLALETSMEAQPLWAIVRDGMSRFACDGDARKLQQMLAAARDTIGVDLDVLFDGLGHDLTLALLLDPVETVTLPTGGNGGLTIPKPDFLILVGASNDAALTFVRNFFKRKGGELIPVETEYGTLYQLQKPLRAPFPMQFAALMHDNTLYFASTPGVILEQLAAEKHTRLASSERFRNTYDDLETEGNVFFYCDARFRAALNHIQDTTASLEGGRNPAALVMNMLIAGRLPEVSSGWVLVNRPDGLLLSGTGTSGFVRQAINGNTNSYLPLIVGGMAIHRIVHARSQALGVKNRTIMMEYVHALIMHNEDAGSLPPDLDVLVARNYLPELKLMENHATGVPGKPLYHGSPNLQVEDLRRLRPKFILLAAPSAGPDGRRLVGYLDGSVQVLAEAEYQAHMHRQP